MTDIYGEVKKKFQTMKEGADTPMEREFWDMAIFLLEKIKNLPGDNALKIFNPDGEIYLWKSKESEGTLQFVNTLEKKAGTKDIGEAVILTAMFVRDDQENTKTVEVSLSEALQKKLEVMTS